jgi:hypothetical protein
MTYLLDVEGLPYRVLAGWVGMVRAGLVWLLCCLPIVTAPAATVILLRTVGPIAAGESAPGLAESLRLLRQEFWPALRLAATVVLGCGLVASALLGPSPGGAWDVVLPAVVLPVAVTWALVSQWAFPVIAQRADGARAALRYAYLRAIRRPDLALISTVGSVAILAVGLVLPGAVWIPYWLTVPALWAGLVTVTSRQAAVTARNN